MINRVYCQGQSYLLTRGGTIVAQLTAAGSELTAGELLAQWETRPRLDPDDAVRWEQAIERLNAAVSPPENTAWDS